MTSAELVQALGIPPELVVSHELRTTTGQVFPGTVVDGADAAMALPDESAVLISNGHAGDGGLGDTDWANDGQRDYTLFTLELRVPAGARSLAFRTRFSTREVEGERDGDVASLHVSTTPCGGIGCVSAPYDLVSALDALDYTSPGTLRILRVASLDTVALTFIIDDHSDGARDSAIRISGFHFSPEESPSEAQLTSEVPPEDVKVAAGTYRFGKTLLSLPGPGPALELAIYFSSANNWSNTFGRKWSHSYEWRLQRLADGGIHIRSGDGGSIYFEPGAGGDPVLWQNQGGAASTRTSFRSSWAGFAGTVARHPDGTYTYTTRQNQEYRFSPEGLLTRIADANGNWQALSYNRGGTLAAVDDVRGYRLEFYYINNFQQLVSVLAYTSADRSSGSQFEFTYEAPVVDAAGNVLWQLRQINEPGLGIMQFAYDALGNLAKVTNADGTVVVDNAYQGETLVSARGGHGEADSYLYFGDAVQHTDRLGRRHTSTFDFQSRLTRKVDPLGHSWRFTYDSHGNLLTQTDPLGWVESRGYDERGNLLSLTDAGGSTTRFRYNDRNNLLEVTDAEGHSTSYQYDTADNLLQETDALGRTQRYTYTPTGQVASMTDRRGAQRTFTYYPGGELAQDIDPLGNAVGYSYGPLAKIATLTDENGQVTSFDYDLAGRLVAMTDPLGNRTAYTVDARGLTTSMTLPGGAVTRYDYDANGRLTRLTDALGGHFDSEYTAVGHLARQTDALGRSTRFDYDDADRLVRVEDAAGGSATADYDAAGRRTSVTDPLGQTTRYRHDALGRVTTETDPLGNTLRTAYDSRGQLYMQLSPRGDAIRHHYDATGRLLQSDLPTHSVIHTVDPNGNAIRTVGRDGATIERDFDPLNRLVRRTDPFGHTLRYEYDAAGNLARLTYSDGKSVRYRYDANNRLVEVVDWEGRITAYEYDPTGNLVATFMPDGSSVSRSYDPARQLLGITDQAATGEVIFEARYEYDAAGQRRAAALRLPLDATTLPEPAVFAYDAANRVAAVNGETFEWDASGNLSTGTLGGERRTFGYDALDRLVSAGDDGFEYDEDGLRIQSSVDGRIVRYVQDPNARLSRVLEERDEQGRIIARYVYGLGLISRTDGSGDTAVYHFDSRGSTVALTDAGGGVSDRFAYDPWGRLVGRTGSTPNPFTFNGRDGVVDDGNGLYFMRARYYAPELMRFIQRDPASSASLLDPQSLNRYSYAGNNPIQVVDPKGEIAPLLVIAAGAAFGIATEIAFDWITGDFDPFHDPWGPYLQSNWVDLTVSAVIGAVTFGGAAKWLSKVNKFPIYKAFWFVRNVVIMGTWRDTLMNFLGKYIVFPLLGYENWTDMVGGWVSDTATRGWETTTGWVSEQAHSAWDATTNWVSDAADWVSDTASDVGRFFSNAWESVF